MVADSRSKSCSSSGNSRVEWYEQPDRFEDTKHKVEFENRSLMWDLLHPLWKGMTAQAILEVVWWKTFIWKGQSMSPSYCGFCKEDKFKVEAGDG